MITCNFIESIGYLPWTVELVKAYINQDLSNDSIPESGKISEQQQIKDNAVYFKSYSADMMCVPRVGEYVYMNDNSYEVVAIQHCIDKFGDTKKQFMTEIYINPADGYIKIGDEWEPQWTKSRCLPDGIQFETNNGNEITIPFD